MPTGFFKLAAERRAVGFVLGLPLNMDGSEGPRAQSTRSFARNLAKRTDLADRVLGRAALDRRGRTRADRRRCLARAKRAAVIDQHAAAFILQGALDRSSRK